MKTVQAILLQACLAMAAQAAASHPAAIDAATTELDRVTQVLCKKDVVVLGEDLHHASAATMAIKARLVQRLVRGCGFGGVVFESQFYDMLDWQHALSTGTASRQQLADAIGALWSRYPEVQPLIGWLHDQAVAGRVHVGGMDPQVGGVTGHFSSDRLPARLSSVLAGERRRQCESAIGRHNRWEYDDAHAFDDAAVARLRACLRDIDTRLEAMGRKAPVDLEAMANSYADYLGFVAGGDRGEARDRSMYRNFTWLRTQWPEGTRIVVWTASVHAAKTRAGAFRPFGSYLHAAFGARAAAIGFSALAGSYGNVGGHGTPHMLAPAVQGSLEARAFATPGARSSRFLDHAALRALGAVPGRVFDYAKPGNLDWSRYFDGVIVLREERAAEAVD